MKPLDMKHKPCSQWRGDTESQRSSCVRHLDPASARFLRRSHYEAQSIRQAHLGCVENPLQ